MYTSPGPISCSEPSSWTRCIRPDTTYPVCSTWQLSVPTMGLTFSDQRHPGSRVNRPAVTSSMLTMSTLPLSKVLVSSGDSTLLAFRDSESTVVRSAPSSHCASVGSQVLARGQDGTGRTPPRPNGLDSQ